MSKQPADLILHNGKSRRKTIAARAQRRRQSGRKVSRRRSDREVMRFRGERTKLIDLNSGQRKRIEAACVDMWEPFRLSIEQWAPRCLFVCDKFHIIQHSNDAVDEVRRAEFFRKGPKMRDLIKGKKWLLMSRGRICQRSSAAS